MADLARDYCAQGQRLNMLNNRVVGGAGLSAEPECWLLDWLANDALA